MIETLLTVIAFLLTVGLAIVGIVSNRRHRSRPAAVEPESSIVAEQLADSVERLRRPVADAKRQRDIEMRRLRMERTRLERGR